MRITCPKCSTASTVPDSAAGKRGACKKCGNVLIVPQADTSDTEPSPALPESPTNRYKVIIGAGVAVSILAAIVAVSIIARLGQKAAEDFKAIDQNSKPATAPTAKREPSFNDKDFVETLEWFHYLTRLILETRETGDAKAIAKLSASFDQSLASIEGKSVAWKLPVNERKIKSIVIDRLAFPLDATMADLHNSIWQNGSKPVSMAFLWLNPSNVVTFSPNTRAPYGTKRQIVSEVELPGYPANTITDACQGFKESAGETVVTASGTIKSVLWDGSRNHFRYHLVLTDVSVK